MLMMMVIDDLNGNVVVLMV